MTPEETRVYGKTLATIAHRIDALSEEELEHLERVPVRRASEAFDAYPTPRDYDFVSVDIEAIDADLRVEGEDEWARAYWQLVAWHLIARSLQSPRPLILPRRIVELELAHFDRIVDAGPAAAVDDPMADTDFLLDLALARRAAVSFGKLVGVPMRFDADAGPHAAGLTPGTWMFTHLEADEYGPEALEEILPTVFEFFRANPGVVGCFGAGWLVDPALADVSPHLTWFRESLGALGAQFVVAENSPDTAEQATRTSSTRRELFEAGTYQPQNWRWTLDRDALLQWDETPTQPGDSA